jgi:hypothetical protein
MIEDYTYSNFFAELNNHIIPCYSTLLIKDSSGTIKQMKLLIKMFNKSTLFNAESIFSDVLVVSYRFHPIEMFTFDYVDTSLIVTNQRYIFKYAKLLTNTELPPFIIAKQYSDIFMPMFFEPQEIKHEAIATLLNYERYEGYLNNFRQQTLFKK